jgi:hypothetical protein
VGTKQNRVVLLTVLETNQNADRRESAPGFDSKRRDRAVNPHLQHNQHDEQLPPCSLLRAGLTAPLRGRLETGAMTAASAARSAAVAVS